MSVPAPSLEAFVSAFPQFVYEDEQPSERAFAFADHLGVAAVDEDDEEQVDSDGDPYLVLLDRDGCPTDEALPLDDAMYIVRSVLMDLPAQLDPDLYAEYSSEFMRRWDYYAGAR